MIRRLDAARGDVKKLHERLERAGLAPPEVLEEVRALLDAEGVGRTDQMAARTPEEEVARA